MKGWLDNYNDYNVSAPEGMEGDGYSNVGRNSSPAWGGQFQNGGWLEKIDNVLSAPARAATYAIEAGAHAIGARKAPPKYEDPSDGLGIDEKKHPYLKLATNIVLDPTNLLGVGAISKIGKLAKGIKTVEKTKNVLQPAVKTAFDAATKAGKASGAITWGRNLGKQHRAFFKEYDVLLKNMYKPEVVEQALKLGAKDAIGVSAIINDLIKQHPEKKEEILKNYKNISKQNTNKNPQQQVIVKDNNAHQYKTIHIGEGEGRFEPIQRQPIRAIKNIKPTGLVHDDMNIEAKLPEIHTEVKHPKSWKYNKIEGGSEESGYINSPEDFEHYIKLKNLYEDKEHRDWLGTKNKIDITPQYQMGGNLPGVVGHMYDRTGSPSKGPRRNQTDVTDASAQNGKEMQYYQNGLDWKPKSISRDGSVIKDDRGQWDHPGEITEISGNTMATHGYGDIPLYVVPDKGKPRMVQPNTGTQKFPGAKKFTEYPMAKNGVNQQDEKTFEQLDQLTNFTNYNKPQPGGWLNKYKS